MKTWQEHCFVEPSVVCALADFIHPGQVAFDVGSYSGGLSVVMSRLVGPMGKVVAFEANPATANAAVDQFLVNGAFNVFMINRAVETHSGKRVKFFLSNGVGDSLFSSDESEGKSIDVQTVCLDDFVESYKIEPDFVKMDIEGAELMALHGFEKYISRKHPLIILEQTSRDFECVLFLRQHGYFSVDLHSYRRLKSVEDYPRDGSEVRNIVCVHESALEKISVASAYRDPKVMRLCNFDDAQGGRMQNAIAFPDVYLRPGRYILETEMSARDGDLPIFSGIVDPTNAFVSRYHAPSRVLAQGRYEMPFHMDEAMQIRPVVVSAGVHDISAAVAEVSVSLLHVEGFGVRPLARMVLGA